MFEFSPMFILAFALMFSFLFFDQLLEVYCYSALWASLIITGLPRWHSGKEFTCQHRRCKNGCSIPGSGRTPGVGNGNPFQSSCLGNSMDRGTWWTIVHKITRGRYDWACMHTVVCVCSVSQSCPDLWGSMCCSPPGSSLCGILQARILEHVAFSFSRDLFNSGIEPASLVCPTLAGRFFTSSATSLLCLACVCVIYLIIQCTVFAEHPYFVFLFCLAFYLVLPTLHDELFFICLSFLFLKNITLFCLILWCNS